MAHVGRPTTPLRGKDGKEMESDEMNPCDAPETGPRKEASSQNADPHWDGSGD